MSKTSSPGIKKKSLFDRIITDNAFCWLSALCTAGISLIIAVCFDMIPFGDNTILRMDMYHQYCPLFAELYDRVTGMQSFLYSWETGGGSAFLGNFYNYLCSPSAFFVLLFGHKNVTEAIAAMIFSKAAFASGAFTYYIKKSYGNHDYISAAFGLLYCMSGWFIAYYWDVMWVDAMVFFPFIILGIEKIINRRRPETFIIALFLTLLTNYYMGYMVCIFSVLYFLVYYFGTCDAAKTDGKEFYWKNPDGKKSTPVTERLRHSILIKSGLTFAGAGIAAACLAAFALVPVYFVLKTSYATNDSFPTEWNSYFNIFDFIANHLSSLEPTIRSSGDDVLPNVYCGMATVMLVPLYLFTKSVPVKEKIANVALLGLLYASFSYNVISFIWHGFHYPSDLPYRFSFMYSFILLTLAYKALLRLNEFSGRELLGAGMAVIGFIILVQKVGSKNVQDVSVIISIIFTVTYVLVFYALRSDKFQKSSIAILLLCCIIGESVSASTQHYDIDQPKKNYAGDYTDFKSLQSNLEKTETEPFYRSELTYNRARMDPAWYGFNGISTFTSMAYEKLSKLEKYLGLSGNNVDSYTYNLQTPVYNMMHALKYVYDNNGDVDVDEDYFTEVGAKGNFTLYKNEYYLPLAFGAGSELENWCYEGSDPFRIQNDWFELATGETEVFKRLSLDDVTYFNIKEITSGLTTGNIYFDKEESAFGQEGEIRFFIHTEKEEHCYIYVDSGYFDSITVSKDDMSVDVNIDDPYVYDLGVIFPDEYVTVLISIKADDDYGNFTFHAYSVNDDVMKKGYQALAKNQIEISDFSDTKFTGKVTVPKNGLIYTSVPYDEGWQIKLNGIEVSRDDIIALGDGFTCIKAKPGEYELSMIFVPKGLLLGNAISIGMLGLLIIISFFIKKKKEKEELELMRIAAAQSAAAFAPEIPTEIELPEAGDIYISEQISPPAAEEPEAESEAEPEDKPTDSDTDE